MSFATAEVGLAIPVEVADGGRSRARPGQDRGSCRRVEAPEPIPQQDRDVVRVEVRDHQIETSVAVQIAGRDRERTIADRYRRPCCLTECSGSVPQEDRDVVRAEIGHGEVEDAVPVQVPGREAVWGWIPTGTPATGVNAPEPFPEEDRDGVRIAAVFATARSSMPSMFRSRTTTACGPSPTAIGEPAAARTMQARGSCRTCTPAARAAIAIVACRSVRLSGTADKRRFWKPGIVRAPELTRTTAAIAAASGIDGSPAKWFRSA